MSIGTFIAGGAATSPTPNYGDGGRGQVETSYNRGEISGPEGDAFELMDSNESARLITIDFPARHVVSSVGEDVESST
jgi:hypothetical protein